MSGLRQLRLKLNFLELKNEANIFLPSEFLLTYFERYTEVRQFVPGHPHISVVFHLPRKQ